MPLSTLSALGSKAPLRILLIRADDGLSVTYSGLLQPLALAAEMLGPERLQVNSVPLETVLRTGENAHAHVVLLVADLNSIQLNKDETQSVLRQCRRGEIWGAVGSAVSWLARTGELNGLHAASPRSLDLPRDNLDNVSFTTRLFELEGNRLTCCGGAASIDFALSLVQALYGASLQATIMRALSVDHVRGPGEHDAFEAQSRLRMLQPKLAEALQLMEANIEEPLATDDIANLVGISRRQLERQFKQFLGNVPSRYYLELRLQRARQLLLDSHHSIVQVGLMCGFSSGSHFSTAYGALFEITPREERQRKLSIEPHNFR